MKAAHMSNNNESSDNGSSGKENETAQLLDIQILHDF